MTLVEFLAPLKKSTNRERCLAVLYYLETYGGTPTATVEGVRAALGRARVPNAAKVNVADVLSKAGHYVDSPGTSPDGRREWGLTGSGRQHVREVLGLPQDTPEIAHNVTELAALAAKLPDQIVRGYLDEAVLCLRVGALRASVVFLWSGAIRTLQDRALGYGRTSLNAALLKHDPKARRVATIDDFANIKDRTALLAMRELGLLDKGEWGTMQEALDLRNRCGHPTNYVPGVKKASAFIEDVVGVVFSP